MTDPGGNDKYADLVQMTNRGKVAVELVAPQLAQRGYDVRPLVAGGLQMGPCYYYIWERLADFRLAPDLQFPYMQFLEWPTATGEFCTGAALALGLTRTLLWGKAGAPCVPDCANKSCGSDDGCYGLCSCGEGGGLPDGASLQDGAPPTPTDGGNLGADSAVEPGVDAGIPGTGTDDSSGCQCGLGSTSKSGLAGFGLLGLLLCASLRRKPT